jgi:hypothetical protein
MAYFRRFAAAFFVCLAFAHAAPAQTIKWADNFTPSLRLNPTGTSWQIEVKGHIDLGPNHVLVGTTARVEYWINDKDVESFNVTLTRDAAQMQILRFHAHGSSRTSNILQNKTYNVFVQAEVRDAVTGKMAIFRTPPKPASR